MKPLLAPFLLASSLPLVSCATPDGASAPTVTEPAALVQYLEVVTRDVDAACAALSRVHGVTFGEPVAELGNARTAPLASGGHLGVRAPLAEHDQPIVRPYLLVADIDSAIEAAEAAGAVFALGATEIPGRGTFAIYFLDGVQYGLWQL